MMTHKQKKNDIDKSHEPSSKRVGENINTEEGKSSYGTSFESVDDPQEKNDAVAESHEHASENTDTEEGKSSYGTSFENADVPQEKKK